MWADPVTVEGRNAPEDHLAGGALGPRTCAYKPVSRLCIGAGSLAAAEFALRAI